MRHIACAVLAVALAGTFACQSAAADSTATAKKTTTAVKSGSAVAAQSSTAPAKTTTNAAVAAAKTKVDSLTIIGTITEVPGKFPPNDLYNYVYIMKYRVVKVEKGTYSGQEILVGVYNPLIARNQIKDKMKSLVGGDAGKFEMGAKHRLVLIKPIDAVWKDAVEDEYFDSDLQKWYALRTDMAK
jgi:hypothetical protein